MPKISVLVPVYNAEKYLGDCLDSILSQTFTDFEVIIIDDGSTDNSGKICDDYAVKDNRVIIYHQSNKGVAATRNRAVSLANAELIAFIDADDIVHKQYLDILYRILKEGKTLMSVTGTYEEINVDKDKMEIHYLSPVRYEIVGIDEEYMIENSDEGYMFDTLFAKLISKNLLEKHRFTDNRIYEDNAISYNLIYDSHTVSKNDYELYFYRNTSGGITKRQIDSKSALDVLWARKERMRFCLENRLDRLYLVVLKKYLVFSAYLFFEINTREPDIAMTIRLDALKLYKANRKRLLFPKEQKLYILEMFFPRMMKLYWKLNNWINK